MIIRRIKMKKTIFYLAVAFIIAGCNNNDVSGTVSASEQPNSNNTNSTKAFNGYYVDAPVANIDYKCGVFKGKTDKKGAFKFEKGKKCKLFIANITLHNLPADALNKNLVIFENNITIATFLQSLNSNATNKIIYINEPLANSSLTK
jgi:hypothetical protein